MKEPKYQLLINKREKAGINFNNDPAAFIEHSNSMDDIFQKLKTIAKRERKVLIIFDDMISHVTSDKKAQ